MQIIRKTQMLASNLPRKRHARDLAPRVFRIEQDDVIADAGGREISVHDSRLENLFPHRRFAIARESRIEFLAHEPIPLVALYVCAAPG